MKLGFPVVAAVALAMAHLAAGVDSNPRGKPLMTLVTSTTPDAEVIALIERGADVNSTEGAARLTPLIMFASWNRPAVIDALVKHGAEINHPAPPSHLTALMTAARGGRVEAIQALLRNGADVSLKNFEGLTALTFAAHDGREEAEALLLKSGAAPEERYADGWTDLMLAVTRGNVEAAKAALAKGDDLNARSKRERNTALHYAAIQGREEMVVWLIEQKADLEVKNVRRQTPLASAILYHPNRRAIAEKLRAAGATE